jgi:hypothetical protein
MGWEPTGLLRLLLLLLVAEGLTGGQGRVTGFAGPDLTSYTSFLAHVDEVRDLLVHDRGVISLGAKNVRVTHRRGLQRWDIKYPQKAR